MAKRHKQRRFRGPPGVVAAQSECDTYQVVYVKVAGSDSDVRGGEPIIAGERAVGVTTSGGYGHTVKKSLALAFVDPEHASPGSSFEVEILAKRNQATVLVEPVYDPKNLRLKS